jgi:calcineurin-like phosphoesterase family protein
MTNIYFTSDLHFGHKHILEHNPNRAIVGGFSQNDIESHDKWLIDKWNSTVQKKDIIYILGDFSFHSPEVTEKLVQKLHGYKFLILGNHDNSSGHLVNYFKQITQIKDLLFKESNYDFLKENLMISMCHYPMVTWNKKHYGCIQLHGHCHGRIDNFNDSNPDLRVDVGLDGNFAKYNFVTLEQVYDYMKNKANGELLKDYAMKIKDDEHPY